jgi:peptidoglycan hydrolase CwlO-like protein
MLRTRLGTAALLAAVAALVALGLSSAAAPAQDLQSKLETREAKLERVRDRKGVLTTTISRYRKRIQRLTGEVAALRSREAAVLTRLKAKQAEFDSAVAELQVGERHLAAMRARLERALVALRERLVAIYETGTPDLLGVVLGSNGYS